MSRKNKPSIRFTGFTDDWEQCKLGDVGKAKSGIGFPDAEQGGSEGTPFFKVSDMNTDGNENELVIANNYVTDEQISRKRWNVINNVPAMFFAKVGAAVMLNRKRLVRSPFLLDNNTMAYIFDKEVWNCEFGKTLFETIDLTKLTQTGALPSYNSSDVEEVEISIPSETEQECVGRYFRQLDNLITLHQRKYDKLVNVKKSMLEKMFPREEAKAPELRFAGFIDDWEKRKLGEITDFVTGKAFSLELEDGGSYIVMDMGAVSQEGNRIETKRTNKHRDVLCEGDLIMPKDDIGGGLIIGRTAYIPADNHYVLGDHVYRLRFSKENGLFVHYQINGNEFRKHVMPLVTGSAQLGLNSKNVQTVFINTPSYDEQIKIGEFLHNLDNLITLHQCKVEKLKNIKSSMMKKMFV